MAQNNEIYADLYRQLPQRSCGVIADNDMGLNPASPRGKLGRD